MAVRSINQRPGVNHGAEIYKDTKVACDFQRHL